MKTLSSQWLLFVVLSSLLVISQAAVSREIRQVPGGLTEIQDPEELKETEGKLTTALV